MHYWTLQRFVMGAGNHGNGRSPWQPSLINANLPDTTRRFLGCFTIFQCLILDFLTSSRSLFLLFPFPFFPLLGLYITGCHRFIYDPLAFLSEMFMKFCGSSIYPQRFNHGKVKTKSTDRKYPFNWRRCFAMLRCRIVRIRYDFPRFSQSFGIISY